MKNDDYILDIENLSVSFHLYNTALEQCDLQVISDLSLGVGPGEIVAVAGSSGSGKSILAHAVLGLLPANATISGKIEYEGAPLDRERQLKLRGKEIALIPQSVNYLDPLQRIGTQVRGDDRSQRAIEKQQAAFRRLQLDLAAESLYPFELSGGMARKVLVSTALVCDAQLIIADEPTPGLDTEIACEALQGLREIANCGKGVVLITHDIDLALEIADRIAVFYAGTTVEIAWAKDFQKGPKALRHPYSKALWQALPQNGFVPIPGHQPYAGKLPTGCVFGPRCPDFTSDCARQSIPMRTSKKGLVKCIHEA